VAFVFALACPVSMGVMMWMMMRGGRHAAGTDNARIEQLEQEIADLRGQDATATPEDRPLTATRH
jgi:hypothetical protein